MRNRRRGRPRPRAGGTVPCQAALPARPRRPATGGAIPQVLAPEPISQRACVGAGGGAPTPQRGRSGGARARTPEEGLLAAHPWGPRERKGGGTRVRPLGARTHRHSVRSPGGPDALQLRRLYKMPHRPDPHPQGRRHGLGTEARDPGAPESHDLLYVAVVEDTTTPIPTPPFVLLVLILIHVLNLDLLRVYPSPPHRCDRTKKNFHGKREAQKFLGSPQETRRQFRQNEGSVCPMQYQVPESPRPVADLRPESEYPSTTLRRVPRRLEQKRRSPSTFYWVLSCVPRAATGTRLGTRRTAIVFGLPDPPRPRQLSTEVKRLECEEWRDLKAP